MQDKLTAALYHGVQTLFQSGAIGQQTDGELLNRFRERRDQTSEHAFAALAERHGPMVLRVCRSILRNEHDAQDAFQATFLILVRRAASVRNRESIGSWLYGVALRVAACARNTMAHRRRHERRAVERATLTIAGDDGRREMSMILHEELGRLPERYRTAIVLCYLEGLTCEAAALQLGWPVGTVKSRLSRGREVLLRRLILRGLGPDDQSGPRQPLSAVLPASLASHTVRAMVELAARRRVDDLIPATALSYSRAVMRSMLFTSASLISPLLVAGLVVAAGAFLTIPAQESARPAGAVPATARNRPPARPEEADKKNDVLSLQVVDTNGQGVPNVEVKVRRDGNSAEEVGRFRTGPGGLLKVSVDALYSQIVFEARPDAQTLGWANIRSGELTPTGRENDPARMVLLPRNHQVEGSVADARGKPIRGVSVQVVQLNHVVNRMLRSYGQLPPEASLGSAVSDAAGRFKLTLPQDARAILAAYHPRYFGRNFGCKSDERTVGPVTLGDAGGIAGTVIDSITKQPVEGAKVGAQLVVNHNKILSNGWGDATSDAHGQFVVGGLEPGVYNLLFSGSPKGKTFVARAVEGVRVKAGEDAQADLVVIKGRRLCGMAIDSAVNKPMAGAPIFYNSLSHPRSGHANQGTATDALGHFEMFVPPGPVFVYIASPGLVERSRRKNLIVPDDRDPEPVMLLYDPADDSSETRTRVDECAVQVRVAAGKTGQGLEERALIGRIFDPSGLPIASVQVYLSAKNLVAKNLVADATDRLGTFRLNGLPRGPLRILIYRGGYRDCSAMIPPDAFEVDITLPKNAELD